MKFSRSAKLFYIVIFSILISMLIIILYIKSQGKLISITMIPQYPVSELIYEEEQDYNGLKNLTRFYVTDASLIDLRIWFHQYIYMSPFHSNDITGDEKSFHSLNHLASLKFSNEYMMLIGANNFLSILSFGLIRPIDGLPDCFNVDIFDRNEFNSSYYNINLLIDKKSVIIIKTCYP